VALDRVTTGHALSDDLPEEIVATVQALDRGPHLGCVVILQWSGQ